MSTTKARVLDVGNCDPDHGMIRKMLMENFDLELDRVMFVDEAVDRMKEKTYALVLFNRLIFADGSEGIELVHRAKANGMTNTPLMMVSNFDDAQEACVTIGGVRGFGKKAIFEPETMEQLSQYLPAKNTDS